MFDINDYPSKLQLRMEDDIVHSRLAAGKSFSERELAERYKADAADISLILPSLRRKGLIEYSGDGTFKILGLPEAKIESVFQYAQKAKLKPTTVVRNVSIIAANEVLSEKLSVEIGAPLFQQVRTRKVDGKVLANQYNFIPYEVCPELEKVDLSQRSFQVTLEENYHTVIKKIEETYTLNAPERDDTEILSLQKGEKVLVVQRMSFSSSGMPLVFADIHVSPAQFHYVEDLWPQAAHLVPK